MSSSSDDLRPDLEEPERLVENASGSSTIALPAADNSSAVLQEAGSSGLVFSRELRSDEVQKKSVSDSTLLNSQPNIQRHHHQHQNRPPAAVQQSSPLTARVVNRPETTPITLGGGGGSTTGDFENKASGPSSHSMGAADAVAGSCIRKHKEGTSSSCNSSSFTSDNKDVTFEKGGHSSKSCCCCCCCCCCCSCCRCCSNGGSQKQAHCARSRTGTLPVGGEGGRTNPISAVSSCGGAANIKSSQNDTRRNSHDYTRHQQNNTHPTNFSSSSSSSSYSAASAASAASNSSSSSSAQNVRNGRIMMQPSNVNLNELVRVLRGELEQQVPFLPSHARVHRPQTRSNVFTISRASRNAQSFNSRRISLQSHSSSTRSARSLTCSLPAMPPLKPQTARVARGDDQGSASAVSSSSISNGSQRAADLNQSQSRRRPCDRASIVSIYPDMQQDHCIGSCAEDVPRQSASLQHHPDEEESRVERGRQSEKYGQAATTSATVVLASPAPRITVRPAGNDSEGGELTSPYQSASTTSDSSDAPLVRSTSHPIHFGQEEDEVLLEAAVLPRELLDLETSPRALDALREHPLLPVQPLPQLTPLSASAQKAEADNRQRIAAQNIHNVRQSYHTGRQQRRRVFGGSGHVQFQEDEMDPREAREEKQDMQESSFDRPPRDRNSDEGDMFDHGYNDDNNDNYKNYNDDNDDDDNDSLYGQGGRGGGGEGRGRGRGGGGGGSNFHSGGISVVEKVLSLFCDADSGLRPPQITVYSARYGCAIPLAEYGKSEKYSELEEGEHFWLDISSPTEYDVRVLAHYFSLHSLTLEDIMVESERREKCEMYDHYMFFIIYALNELDTIEIQVPLYAMLFRNCIVTLHPKAVPTQTMRVLSRLQEFRPARQALQPDFVMYCLIDEIVDKLYPIIDAIEFESRCIEDLVMILHQEEHGDMLRRICRGNHRLTSLLRNMNVKDEIIKSFLNRITVNFFGDTDLFLRDIQDHMYTLQQSLQICKEKISISHSVYISQISLRHAAEATASNKIMEKLSYFGAILLPLTFVTGLFGMNVEVPGQTTDGSAGNLNWFWGLLATMVLFAVTSGLAIKMMHYRRHKSNIQRRKAFENERERIDVPYRAPRPRDSMENPRD